MRKALPVIAFLALALALCAGALFYGLRSNKVVPPPPAPIRNPIEKLIPAGSESVILIGDFQHFIAAVSRTALGRIITDNSIMSPLYAMLSGDAASIHEYVAVLLKHIRQAVFVYSDGRPNILLDLDEHGENAFRDILAKLCAAYSLTLVFEQYGEVLRRSSNGNETELLAFRFERNWLFVTTQSDLLESMPVESEEHFVPRTSGNQSYAICAATLDRSTNRRRWFTCDIEKDKFVWSIDVPAEADGITSDTLGRDVIGLDRISAAATLQSSFLFSLVEHLAASLTVDGEGVKGLFGSYGEMFELVQEHCADGPITVTIPAGSVFTDYVVSLPVKDEAALLSALEAFAKEDGLTVGSTGKEITYYYVAEKDRSLSRKYGKMKFWTVRDNFVFVSPSQFSLVAVLRDKKISPEYQGKKVSGFVAVDAREIAKILAPMTMAFAFTGSSSPDFTRLADYIGREEIYLLREDGRWTVEGTNSLPLGILLHVLFTGYNYTYG